jgi:hypothetical protein
LFFLDRVICFPPKAASDRDPPTYASHEVGIIGMHIPDLLIEMWVLLTFFMA